MEITQTEFAWVEPKSGALVKAMARFDIGATGQTPATTFVLTYDVTQATVAPIVAPSTQ